MEFIRVLSIWKMSQVLNCQSTLKIMKQAGWYATLLHVPFCALPLSLKQIGSKVALAQTIHLFASAPGVNRLRRAHAISQIMTTFLGHGTLLRRIQATILVSQEHQNGTRLKDLALQNSIALLILMVVVIYPMLSIWPKSSLYLSIIYHEYNFNVMMTQWLHVQ